MATTKRPRRSQAERTRDTRGQIVAAAVEVLRDGFANFTIDRVARLANVSRGAQTHHFPTKDALVLAAVEQAYRDTTRISLDRIDRLRPKEDAVAAVMEDAEQFFMGPFFRVVGEMLNATYRAGPTRLALLKVVNENRNRAFSAWVEALEARGAMREQAEDVVWLCLTVARGIGARILLADEPEVRQRGIANVHRMALEVLAKKVNRQHVRFVQKPA